MDFRKYRLNCPSKIFWKDLVGMSDSDHDDFENKNVIIVAGWIFGFILIVGLIGVGLTLAG